MKVKGINIREDQQTWLEKHPEFNLSGLVRRAIDEEMEKERIVKEAMRAKESEHH